MAWSGTTKFIRQMVIVKGRPVEFPGLGIFNPITLQPKEEAAGEKLTSENLGALNQDQDIEFYVYQSFMSSCQNKIRITRNSGMCHEF